MDYTEEISTWEPFHDHFHLRADTVTLYTRKVQVCSEALNASNVRHPPITSRIKSWESAKGSVNRRNRERVIRKRIRDLVESQGRRWDDYARETGSGIYGEETEPFKGPEEMFSALHDFGGVRISLYFPGDIERVAAIVNGQFTVLRQIEKGHGSQANVQSLEERLELLQNPERSTQAIDDRVLQRSMRTFTGYKATHFVVKLRDEHIRESQKHSWKDIVVEIQVGTLVMHVWSEIEHDMIYKPLDSQDEAVSEDEKRILDLINGIVLTGEAALRQLEASTAQRLNKRAEDKNAMASSHYELATWIEKHFNERKKSFEGTGLEWRHLEQLFTILKATGSHKHSQVTGLIEDATQRTLSRHLLPMEMLWALGQERAHSEWPGYNTTTPDFALAHTARLWALHLVHSMNLATYLGVVEEFLQCRHHTNPPSITSFLDILHPHQPLYSSAEVAENIINFCKAILGSEHKGPETLNPLVKLAKSLPVTHLVGGFAEGISHTIPVPATIVRLLAIEDDELNYINDMDDMDELYHILDLIDLYASSHGNRDDLLVIWDSLTAQSTSSTDRKPVKDRFFIPGFSFGNSPIGHWKLIDQVVNIQKINREDEKYDQPHKFTTTGLEKQDGVVKLACRLNQEDKWTLVLRAWNIIKPLRRERRRVEIEIVKGYQDYHSL